MNEDKKNNESSEEIHLSSQKHNENQENQNNNHEDINASCDSQSNDTEQEIDLVSEIKILQEELKKKDKEYLLLKAEFSNFQKRQKKFEEERAKYAIQRFVIELLPQLDTFEQALATDKTVASEKLLEGFNMIYQRFKKVLTDFDIKEIETQKGDVINPEIHEVMFTAENPQQPSNTVFQVIQKGYMLSDRVIRATKVASVQNPELQTKTTEAESKEE